MSTKRETIEAEFIDGYGVELLELKDDAAPKGVIEGYASIFNEVDRGNDIVLPGAFTKSLRDKRSTRLPMLVGHAQRIPVGVWQEMREDSKGLFVRGWIDIESQDGGQLYRVMKQKAEIGISIGYRAIQVEYRQEKDRDQIRLLKEVDLYEISLVTIPMCDGARITAVKSQIEIAPGESDADIMRKAAIRAIETQTDAFAAELAIERAIALFAKG